MKLNKIFWIFITFKTIINAANKEKLKTTIGSDKQIIDSFS